ncbi:MAG: hypothetical protein RL154_354 [Pseudomonadota bacterium]|jgi:SEC-C motif-containing protein
MKISQNDKCPCGSGKKYKLCCEIYHKGVKAPNALLLMKSRYCAYAINKARYIIKTTHPKSPYFEQDLKVWEEELNSYCANTEFIKLEILDFTDGENEAFVTFKASFSGGVQIEKSRFLKENGIWFYLSGVAS